MNDTVALLVFPAAVAALGGLFAGPFGVLGGFLLAALIGVFFLGSSSEEDERIAELEEQVEELEDEEETSLDSHR